MNGPRVALGGARSCWPRPSRGPPSRSPITALLADRSVARQRAQCSTFRSICRAACGRFSRRRLLWGASFPFALAAAAARRTRSRTLVGGVYAANTVGGIFGALGFSIILIPWIGTQDSQRLLIALAAISALIVFASLVRSLGKGGVAAIVASVVAIIWIIASISPVPWLAVAYGRRMMLQSNPGRALYVGEGSNYSVVVSELPDGERYFHVSREGGSLNRGLRYAPASACSATFPRCFMNLNRF